MNHPPFLRNIWYYALPGKQLKPGKTIAKVILGEPIVLGRTQSGAIFALRDICPHRAVPLSCGRFDGKEIECCYHGWRFDSEGVCSAIPSLVDDQKLDLTRFRVKQYLVEEVQGNIWIYMPEGDYLTPPPPKVEIPIVPHFEGQTYQLADSLTFRCSMDHTVTGLMDPTHSLFVHKIWWWQGNREPYEVAQSFAPSDYGFTLLRHKVPEIPRIIRLVGGGEPEVEISFRLPGVRIEQILTQKHSICDLTAVTPISETETEITFVIYWTLPWATVIKPLLSPLIRDFLAQDGNVLEKQQSCLQYDPKLMLIKDADTQMRWYFQLKAEYARAMQEGKPFENPVKETVLRWRN